MHKKDGREIEPRFTPVEAGPKDKKGELSIVSPEFAEGKKEAAVRVYSHSALSTFEVCPLQYKLKYIDRVEVEAGESIEVFLGKRVHATLEWLYGCVRYSRVPALIDVIRCYGENWKKNWNDAVVVRRKGLTAKDYRETGAKCLKSYYLRHAPFDRGRTIGIEQRLTFSLCGDGRYRMRGYIDRLDRVEDGVYEIHDYKTSGRLPLQEDLDADRQLALYEIAVRERFGDARKVGLVWHYLIFDMSMTSERTQGDLENLKKEVIALIDAIEAEEEFNHRESALCDWCDYQEHCPARKEIFRVESLPPHEYLKDEGVMLVNRYASLWKEAKEIEAEKERVRESLVEYARKEGVETVKGSDFTVKVSFKEKLRFPGAGDPGREELEAAIKAAGCWDDVSRLDTNALVKAVESGEMDEGLLKKVKRFASFEESVSVSQPRVVKEEK